MRYTKNPLTYEQQADLLISRGLVTEKDKLITTLKSVNYYRLSAYLYPYRDVNDNYEKETTLDKVWKHYTFDRQLRLILIDAIERVEIYMRT